MTTRPLNIIILGSTGSIGTQTLEVIRKNRKHLKVIGLACHSNENLLKKQAKRLNLPSSKTVLTSKNPKLLTKLICTPKADIIVNAIAGSAGLKPSIATLKAGKTLALANKESIILGGKRLMKLAAKHGAQILPLDSEHHAVLRLLQTRNLTKYSPVHIEKITLTCSGGPFFNTPRRDLAKITPAEALKNPNWDMGPKILIESATLLNKGFELIEAHHLFNCPISKLDAVIDRKSYIHAIVKFRATSGARASDKTPAQSLGLAYKPDMKIVIENTLLPHKTRRLKFITGPKLKNYPFKKISHRVFPAITQVLKAHKAGTLTKFYKRTEKNIKKFLEGKVGFTEIV
jgi:1-deoxy-D-xylulose-5-phosphate reductoisomerase